MKTILEKVKLQIKKAMDKTDKPVFVAFDADGTLWPSDVGKNFFLYQAENDLLKEKVTQPEAEFKHLCEREGKKQALLWLAQVQAGFSLKQMNQWVSDFLKTKPFKVFLFQKHLIDWLISKNVQVFVVSSSLKWVLDKALKGYGIPQENIIGVKTLVKEGIITEDLVLPAPIHKDKVQALKNLAGRSPLFSAGNTLSDQALLECASHVRLVVSTAKVGERNYESERSLLKIARERNWLYQDGMPELV